MIQNYGQSITVIIIKSNQKVFIAMYQQKSIRSIFWAT